MSATVPATIASAETAARLAEQEAFAIGYHACVWGYVYVKTMLLRDEALHPDYAAHAPLNSLYIHAQPARPGFTDVTPNTDTLYGLGWLDLGPGPVLMHVPHVDAGRYWSVKATDAALNCAEYVGSRMGSRAGAYAYCQTGWHGELPAGAHRIDLPTRTAFIQLRMLVRPGLAGDIERVAGLNRAFRFEASYAAPAAGPRPAAPRSPKNNAPHFHTLAFFALLNEAITRDAPIPGEAALAAQFAALGIGPGLKFDPEQLSEPQRHGLQAGLDAAFERLGAYLRDGGEQIGGWRFVYRLGRYGHDFLARSAAACFGYGAQLPAEASYAFTVADGQGRPMDGSRCYRIRFGKEDLPPVRGFWSIAAHTLPENQLAENTIGRYSVSSETPGLACGDDGSLEICVQHEAPQDPTLRANWLPTPARAFWLVLRLWQPQEAVLAGRYAPPAVERLPA